MGKLIPFLRSPVWITTGFGAKFAGPGGTNFECEFKISSPNIFTYIQLDKEQREEFEKDPVAHMKYCRELEGELNKRFTLVSLVIVRTSTMLRFPQDARQE